MTTVRVKYHQEPEGWWAESPDVEGFVASGSSLREVRALTREGLPFFLQEPSVELVEDHSLPGPVVDVQMTTTVEVTTSAALVQKVLVRGTNSLGRAPLGTLPRTVGAV